jgi:hypothetical protein
MNQGDLVNGFYMTTEAEHKQNTAYTYKWQYQGIARMIVV